MARMVGGFSATKQPNDEVKAVLQKVGGDLERELKLGASGLKAEVVSFSSQVVAGTNFLIKVKIFDEKDPSKVRFAHVKVFRDLKGNVVFKSITDNKTLDDPLNHANS